METSIRFLAHVTKLSKSRFNSDASVLQINQNSMSKHTFWAKKKKQLIENAVSAINFKPGTVSHSPICISNKTRVGLLSDSSSILLLLWSGTWLLSVSLNRLPVPRRCEYRSGVNINEVSEVFWIFSAITTPHSHFNWFAYWTCHSYSLADVLLTQQLPLFTFCTRKKGNISQLQ